MGNQQQDRSGRPADPYAGLPQLVLRYRDQLACAAVLLLCLLLLIGQWFFFGGHRGEIIEIHNAPRRQAEFKVDINQAEWPELMMLPGIGKTTAKRIVDYRTTHGPFTSHAGLLDVEGIGERTLGRLHRHLLPIEEVQQRPE